MSSERMENTKEVPANLLNRGPDDDAARERRESTDSQQGWDFQGGTP